MALQLHLMRKECCQAGTVIKQHGLFKGQSKQMWRPGHLTAAAVCIQVHRQFRKPLIVMSPKNLLRHPEAKSGLWEFDDVADDKGILGVRFKRVIMDESVSDRWAWLLGDACVGRSQLLLECASMQPPDAAACGLLTFVAVLQRLKH